MKVSRRMKMAEAHERMEMLGFERTHGEYFEKYGVTYYAKEKDTPRTEEYEELLAEKMIQFEQEYNTLVYGVIQTVTDFGELFNFLYVSDYMEEWEADRERLKNGCPSAYVWNASHEEWSEIGVINLSTNWQGDLRRVA